MTAAAVDEARLAECNRIYAVAADHYWDSLEDRKEIVLAHLRDILGITSVSVDPSCVDLAHHFLMADPIAKPISDAEAARNLTSLSEHIQHAIDDWFAAAISRVLR